VQALKRAVNSENNQFIGVSRGGKTTKIHAVVNEFGNPVHFILTSGEEHDSKQATPLLSELKIADSNILADKAYGTVDIRNYISEHGASYVIPPKTNAKEPWEYDTWLYKVRHLIECFFNKIKAFRRVATRYNKLASSFLDFVYIASIWLLSK